MARRPEHIDCVTPKLTRYANLIPEVLGQRAGAPGEAHGNIRSLREGRLEGLVAIEKPVRILCLGEDI